jgi:hypothetical protein
LRKLYSEEPLLLVLFAQYNQNAQVKESMRGGAYITHRRGEISICRWEITLKWILKKRMA